MLERTNKRCTIVGELRENFCVTGKWKYMKRKREKLFNVELTLRDGNRAQGEVSEITIFMTTTNCSIAVDWDLRLIEFYWKSVRLRFDLMKRYVNVVNNCSTTRQGK